MPSTGKVIAGLQIIQNNIPSINLISKELSIAKSKKNSQKKINLINFEKLEVINLSYNYPDSEKIILKDVNCEFLNNKFIGISGESGSGKTTFIDILIGLIKPSGGSILVNGNDINSTEEWQNFISYVLKIVF